MHDIHCKTDPVLPIDESLDQITHSLNTLCNEMNDSEAFDFLHLCLQELSKISQQLNQSIHIEDWNAAKKITHRLLGTAHLYGSLTLQELLHTINAGMIPDQELKQVFLKIQAELILSEQRIKAYLKNDPV